MGGALTATSEEGVGSSFILELPNAKEHLAETPDSLNAPLTSERSNLKGATILIIDDDTDARELTRRALERENFNVEEAENAHIGIQKAHQIQPDVIILDVMMPEKDGWETLAELKGNPTTDKIPVVMMSMVENSKVGFSLGASDYLVKPVKKEALLESMKGQLHRSDQFVLVVDDDEMARDMVKRALDRAGIRSSMAKTGSEAIDFLKGTDLPGVVLLDLMMPEVNGFEVIQFIQEQGLDDKIKVIVLSAMTLKSEDRAELNRMVHKVAQKGRFSPGQIARDVQKLISANHSTIRKAA